MQFSDGEKMLLAKMQRRMASVPTTYTVWKDSTTIYAESNTPGGTDYTGTAGTDDVTVIQQAIDALPATASERGKILLKAGPQYEVHNGETINLRSYMMLEGEGFGTRIRNVNTDYGSVTMLSTAETGQISNIRISDLIIDGGTYADKLLHIPANVGLDESYFERVFFFTGFSYGVYLEGGAEEVFIKSCFFDGNAKQLVIANTPAVSYFGGMIVDNMFWYGSNAISILDHTPPLKISGNQIIRHNKHVIYCDAAENIMFTDNMLDDFHGTADFYSVFYLVNACKNIQITDNKIYDIGSHSGITGRLKYVAVFGTGTMTNVVFKHNILPRTVGTAIILHPEDLSDCDSITVPFVSAVGTAAWSDLGIDVDAATEGARAFAQLPSHVYVVPRLRIWATSTVTEADAMHLEVQVMGGAADEARNTHNYTGTNLDSAVTNMVANDVIYWEIADSAVQALTGGDSVDIKVLHEAAGDGDCATDAQFRCVQIDYV